MRDQYLRVADGFIFVYARNHRGSFSEIHLLIETAKRVKDTGNSKIVCILNSKNGYLALLLEIRVTFKQKCPVKKQVILHELKECNS